MEMNLAWEGGAVFDWNFIKSFDKLLLSYLD